ncbi:MAG TPA: GtrA family protein [Streptosporangiaceae bacterium]|jgi:putative flippase GtrA
MAGATLKVSKAAWHLLPAPLRRKLRSEPGRRFMRFVPVSLAALGSSQLTLALLVGVIGMSAGTAAFIASIVGAGVSYLLSRWAWERKGRPDLLRETLPFWVVSVAAWTFLSFISHEASMWSKDMGHSQWEHVAVVNGAYFLANCVTFVARFAIFHYVLFANREGRLPGQRARTPAAPQDGSEHLNGTAPNGTAPNGTAARPAEADGSGSSPATRLEMAGQQQRAEPRARR